MKLQMTNSREFIAIPLIRNYTSCDLYSMNHTVKWIIWVALPLRTIVVVVEVHPFNHLYLPQILNFNHSRLTIYVCGWSSYFQTYLFQSTFRKWVSVIMFRAYKMDHSLLITMSHNPRCFLESSETKLNHSYNNFYL